jgi:hypothetical protein
VILGCGVGKEANQGYRRPVYGLREPSRQRLGRASSQLPVHPDTLLLEDRFVSRRRQKRNPEAVYFEPIPEAR